MVFSTKKYKKKFWVWKGVFPPHSPRRMRHLDPSHSKILGTSVLLTAATETNGDSKQYDWRRRLRALRRAGLSHSAALFQLSSPFSSSSLSVPLPSFCLLPPTPKRPHPSFSPFLSPFFFPFVPPFSLEVGNLTSSCRNRI